MLVRDLPCQAKPVVRFIFGTCGAAIFRRLLLLLLLLKESESTASPSSSYQCSLQQAWAWAWAVVDMLVALESLPTCLVMSFRNRWLSGYSWAGALYGYLISARRGFRRRASCLSWCWKSEEGPQNSSCGSLSPRGVRCDGLEDGLNCPPSRGCGEFEAEVMYVYRFVFIHSSCLSPVSSAWF